MFEQVLKSMFRGNFTKSASQKRDPAKGCSFVPAVSENVAFGVRKEMAGHEPNSHSVRLHPQHNHNKAQIHHHIRWLASQKSTRKVMWPVPMESFFIRKVILRFCVSDPKISSIFIQTFW
jgi:hypothetical protein